MPRGVYERTPEMRAALGRASRRAWKHRARDRVKLRAPSAEAVAKAKAALGKPSVQTGLLDVGERRECAELAFRLYQAFPWKTTVRGWEYWEGVSQELQRLAGLR
jgi:hypothetical protein